MSTARLTSASLFGSLGLFLIAAIQTPNPVAASEDILVRTFQAAYENTSGDDVRIIPVWFVACCALPEEQVAKMCQPNLANDGRLAPSPDMNLFSLYGLRAAVTDYVDAVPVVTLDLMNFRRPEKIAINEELILKAAVECLRRIAGDLGIARVRVIVRAESLDSTAPARWRVIEGSYESIRESGR